MMINKQVLTRPVAIKMYYEEDKSMQQIGDKYGITREAVRQRMERWGLPRNTKRGGRRVWEASK